MAVPESLLQAERADQWIAPVEHRRRLTAGRIAAFVGQYVLFAVLLVLFLLPFLWMFFGAVRRESEILGMMFPLTIHTLIPVEWSIDSFLAIYGISDDGRAANLQFHRGLMNSGITAGAVVLFSP